ncbi:MAG: Mrp/NBP35 family ATP-binding protein [Henriciella sp.]
MFWDKKQNKSLSEDIIREVLGNPEWISGVTLREDGHVTLVLEADPENLEMSETRRIETEARLMNMEGVTSTNIVLTAQRSPDAATASPPSARQPIPTVKGGSSVRRVRKGARLSDEAVSQGKPDTPSRIAPVPGISRILVVASAKGGVGKSTVAVNLATAFAKQGLRTGLLDADIYGPSIPTMLGTADASPAASEGNKLVPVEAHGVHTLSIGYLTDPDAPMIWRGPIVQSAITQMLNDAVWGTEQNPLDLLIIDTPPGTGEAQLTLAQKIPVDAAIIVTTPQEVALADVRRGAAMFAKTHVPILGIVETMSWFEDPTGARHYLMGQDGGGRMSRALGLPLIGQLPILQAIREGSDQGHPATLKDDQAAKLFTELARDIALRLDAVQTKPPPQIIFAD